MGKITWYDMNNIQTLYLVQDAIYKPQYDNLSPYLQGVRDVINMLSGLEDSEDIAKHIINEINKIEKKG